MALNINGTTGISGVDGSLSAPAVTGTDSNTGITFPSADTIKFATGGVERLSITNSGVTGTGLGTNTPAFSVYRNGTQSIGSNTATKVQYNTENFDTDNTFDNSTNYRYTPAFSGKSFLVASLRLYGTDDFNNFIIEIRKNGTSVLRQQNSHFHYESTQVSGIVTHDTDDYFEVFVTQQSGSSLDVMSGSDITYFMGYKIIE